MPLARVVDYFKGAAAGSDVGRRLLLGPPSGGKSTLAILLKRALEEYSRTDDGALWDCSAAARSRCNSIFAMREMILSSPPQRAQLSICTPIGGNSQIRIGNVDGNLVGPAGQYPNVTTIGLRNLTEVHVAM